MHLKRELELLVVFDSHPSLCRSAIFLAFSKFLIGGIVGSHKFVVVANANFFLVVLVLEIYVLFFTVWLHDVNHKHTNRAIGKGHSLLI